MGSHETLLLALVTSGCRLLIVLRNPWDLMWYEDNPHVALQWLDIIPIQTYAFLPRVTAAGQWRGGGGRAETTKIVALPSAC